LNLDSDLVWVLESSVSDEQMLKVGDIAICLSSGSASLVGKTAPLRTPWRGTVGAFCGIVRPSADVAPDFIAHWFRSPAFGAWLREQVRGASIQNLRLNQLAKTEILLPRREDQVRKASKLNEQLELVEGARAAAEARLEAARALTDSIVEQAFAHHDRTRRLGDLGDGRDSFADGPFGSHLKTEHYAVAGARVIRLQNIGRGRFLNNDRAFIDMSHFESLRRHSVQPDDVVVAALGDGARPAGRACLVPADLGPALVKADCFRVRLPKERINPRFLMWWLNSPRHLREVRERMRGATRPRFTLGMVQQSRVPLPPQREQERMVQELDGRLQQAERCRLQVKDEIESLEALPAALLRCAFRGEV
jgi:type I restriction enzyme S subunit